jgi:hypothetical protein
MAQTRPVEDIVLVVYEALAAVLSIVSLLIHLKGVYLDCLRLRCLRRAVKAELNRVAAAAPDVENAEEWHTLRDHEARRPHSAPQARLKNPILNSTIPWCTLPPLTWA